MNQNYFTLYLSKKNLGGLLILLFTCFWIVGCSEEKRVSEVKESVSIEDKNITAIRAVIEQEFTAPNDEFIRLQKDHEVSMAEWEAYEELVEKTYKPYYTDNAFEKLIPQNFAFVYHFYLIYSEDESYELSVSDIVIKQEEEHPTIYRFTFEVEFVNSVGEISTHQLRGEAICPEEGKIGRIGFMEDSPSLREAILKKTDN